MLYIEDTAEKLSGPVWLPVDVNTVTLMNVTYQRKLYYSNESVSNHSKGTTYHFSTMPVVTHLFITHWNLLNQPSAFSKFPKGWPSQPGGGECTPFKLWDSGWKGYPFQASGLWNYVFHYLKYIKGWRNLLFWPIERLKIANIFILWLWKNREDILVFVKIG